MIYHNIDQLRNGRYELRNETYRLNKVPIVEKTDEGIFMDGDKLTDEDIWTISDWEDAHPSNYIPI